MLDVITRRVDLELTLQIGAEILGYEDPRNRGDHPDILSGLESFTDYSFVTKTIIKATFPSYNHWMVLQSLV